MEPRTTLVIFADKHMADIEWEALFDALHKGAENAAMEAPALKGGVELVRGDTMVHGLEVSNPISVYLHGECRLDSHAAVHADGGAGMGVAGAWAD